MNRAEKLGIALRHNRHFEQMEWLWEAVRPFYNRVVNVAAPRGLERIINGTDKVLVAPRWRMIGEEYEPDVWRSLMDQVKPGDIIADVGSYIGLYTVALAHRVGTRGRVIGFEPDESNYQALKKHVDLNGVANRVTLFRAAVGDVEGFAEFTSNLDSSSIRGTIDRSVRGEVGIVPCVTLDGVFEGKKLDLMKVDVEGYEEKVLEGASGLLADANRSPRAIFVEVHPYAWPAIGTTSDSLLSLLHKFSYDVRTLRGERVQRIDEYGEVIAYRKLD